MTNINLLHEALVAEFPGDEQYGEWLSQYTAYCTCGFQYADNASVVEGELGEARRGFIANSHVEEEVLTAFEPVSFTFEGPAVAHPHPHRFETDQWGNPVECDGTVITVWNLVNLAEDEDA